MDNQIFNIIDNYVKKYNLELVDLTLFENINNIIDLVFKSVENIDDYYEETENVYILPKKIRIILYFEFKKYLKPYFDEIDNQINILDNIPLINQREEGWYAFRNELISASSIHNVLNYNGNPNTLFLEKIGISMPFLQNEAIIHGIIFEIVSQCIYESRCNITIREYGCIPHNNHSFIGASPDGVVHNVNDEDEYNIFRLALYGRLLEIKNPSSRKITNSIKPSYFSQIIAQQEVCKLPICDFLETKFNMFESIDKFFESKLPDSEPNNIPNYYIPLCNLSNNYKEKGVLLKFRKDKSFTSELYPLHIPYVKEEIEEWIDKKVKEYEDNGFDFEQAIYWQLKEYSVKTVKFDKNKWEPLYNKSKELWDDVLEYRKLSDNELLEKIKNYDLELIDKKIVSEKPKDTKYKLRNVQKKRELEVPVIDVSKYNF